MPKPRVGESRQHQERRVLERYDLVSNELICPLRSENYSGLIVVLARAGGGSGQQL